MKVTEPLKGITLTQYNKDFGSDPTASLYVMNRTVPRGRSCFSVMGDLGQPATVIVPSTFIPVDLTTQATRDSLMKSSQFRSLLSNNDLVIVSNLVAEELLTNNPRARTEHKRLFNADFVPTMEFEMGDNAPLQQAAPEANDTGEDFSDNVIVNSIILRCNSGEESADAIINAILNQSDSLTSEDLVCIANNVTDSEVKDFCLDQQ